MSEVTINYKDAAIATMDASGTKTLQTQGKYCEDDIEVVYARPSAPSGTKQISITQNGTTVEDVAAYADAEITVNVQGGGSGATVIASGSFVGDTTSGRMTVYVGNKMPQTDFYICIKAEDDTEFEQNTDYTFTALTVLVLSDFGYYDLSAVGNSRPFVSNFPIKNNNSGTITTLNSGRIVKNGAFIRSGSINELLFNTFNIDRLSTEFSIYIGHSNSVYKFPSTVTYEWEIVYFGSNPNTDIITIS